MQCLKDILQKIYNSTNLYRTKDAAQHRSVASYMQLTKDESRQRGSSPKMQHLRFTTPKMHCIKGFVTIKYVNTQKTPFCVDKVAQIAPGRPQTPDFGQKWLNNAPKMPQITREKQITGMCWYQWDTFLCCIIYNLWAAPRIQNWASSKDFISTPLCISVCQ